ncbi:ArsR/SmtB family transcription factor [Acinetobacter courvalinii]|nr:helix-turn-helix transcriptional regulator [Acinetobacter courvalinii]
MMSNADAGNTIAEIASLVGDTSRAKILTALMSGMALTAGELADHADITAQTASGHLAKLTEAMLISLVKQGRHRYYKLANPQVAQMLQALMCVAAPEVKLKFKVGPKDESLRIARTCYDHIAGKLGVALVDAFSIQGYILLQDDAFSVTPAGIEFFADFGINLITDCSTKQFICRTCLDWSERRPHIAGQLGVRLLECLIEMKWLVRMPDSRALSITSKGQKELHDRFHLKQNWWQES